MYTLLIIFPQLFSPVPSTSADPFPNSSLFSFEGFGGNYWYNLTQWNADLMCLVWSLAACMHLCNCHPNQDRGHFHPSHIIAFAHTSVVPVTFREFFPVLTWGILQHVSSASFLFEQHGFLVFVQVIFVAHFLLSTNILWYKYMSQFFLFLDNIFVYPFCWCIVVLPPVFGC